MEIDIQSVKNWPQAVKLMDAHLHCNDSDETFILKNPRTNEEVSRRISTCLHALSSDEQERLCIMFHFVKDGCWIIPIENFEGEEIGFHPNAVGFYIKNGESRLLLWNHFTKEITKLCSRNKGYSIEASLSVDAECLLTDIWEPLKLLLKIFPTEWVLLPADISSPTIAGNGGAFPFLTAKTNKAVAEIEQAVQQIIICLHSGTASRNTDTYRRLTSRLACYSKSYPEETATVFWKYGAELVQAYRSLDAPQLKQMEGSQLEVNLDSTLDLGESLLRNN